MASKQGLFARLTRTRQSLADGLKGLFASSGKIDPSIFEEIEDQLIMADLGITTAQSIISQLKSKADRSSYTSSTQLLDGLREIFLEILDIPVPENRRPAQAAPVVLLMVGVNGVGKTTTLAKIANQYKGSGSSVMLAACDTFRAAAIEQLQTWGQRLDIPVMAQSHGADAAAVAFDAFSAARARGVDYLLIDSAGRQHTHGDLMEQLQKIKRVLAKIDESAPHEVFLTVDAGNGQNVLSQVEHFHNRIPLTGICVTKLDGTAKGGIVISLAQRFGLPIHYIGVGEGIDDLRPFDAAEYVDALLPQLKEE